MESSDPVLDIGDVFDHPMASTRSTSSIPAGMENFTVGLIGMGDMGRMYAERLSEAGWR